MSRIIELTEKPRIRRIPPCERFPRGAWSCDGLVVSWWRRTPRFAYGLTPSQAYAVWASKGQR